MDFGPADDSGQGASNIYYSHQYILPQVIMYFNYFCILLKIEVIILNELPEPDKVIDIDLPKVAKKGLYHYSSSTCHFTRHSFYIGRRYLFHYNVYLQFYLLLLAISFSLFYMNFFICLDFDYSQVYRGKE